MHKAWHFHVNVSFVTCTYHHEGDGVLYGDFSHDSTIAFFLSNMIINSTISPVSITLTKVKLHIVGRIFMCWRVYIKMAEF